MEPRLIKLLEVLQRNADNVVKKEDILNSAWGDVVVNEESITRAIFDLRKDLDKRFANPPKIQTIRKVGYRLKNPGEESPEGSKSILKVIGKVVAFTILILAFVIILIRAINY